MRINQRAQHVITLIAAMAILGACESSSDQADATDAVELTIDALVTTEWLSEHLDDPDLVVLDCTVFVEPDENGAVLSSSGRASYEAGHIPSA